MTEWDGLPLTEYHVGKLTEAAITPEVASAHGVRSATTLDELPEHARRWGSAALPALIFPYRSASGAVIEQVKPDTEIPVEGDPRGLKYLFPKGSGSALNVLRVVEGSKKALIVEGTKQGLAAAGYAPDDWSVYGIAGCRNWSTDGTPITDLEVFEDQEVVVVLDADVATNLSVWEAGERLGRALDFEGATSIKFAQLAGGAKSGLDDELGKVRHDRRAGYLARVIAKAGKLPGKPRGRKAAGAGEESETPSGADLFFSPDGLMVEDLCNAIRDKMPAALTEEQRVALYRGGVYNIDKTAIIAAVGQYLGNRNRPGHRAAVEEHMIAQLVNAGLFLPVYVSDALLNVPGGMVDLATGVLKPHDPAYFSVQQIPVDWEPDAQCPTYLQWAEKCGILGQLDDLEEAVSTMLDPSRTPTKAVFLFGPSRSGKSTFLRLMQRIVGTRNLSSVTLHQLSQNRFMAANVFGKMLNCAADLSSAHVEDISIFKMMAGDDPIQADRKYGGQFSFTNRALFAFSANELPTVGESSRAYVERIKPFEFPVSFAGREDPTMEEKMIAEELPGILVRWVRAWQRKQARGGRYLPTDPRVLREFEIRSDRVRQWVEAQCDIWTETADGSRVVEGTTIEFDRALTRSDLAKAFNAWAESNNTSKMGMSKVIDRLLTIPGVFNVRRLPKGSRAINVTVRKDKDLVWHPDGHEGEASADPSADLGGPSADPSADLGGPSAVLRPVSADPSSGIADENGQVSELSADPSAVSAVLLVQPPSAASHAISEVTGSKGLFVSRVGQGSSETAETAGTADALFEAPEPPPVERGPLQPTPPVTDSAVRPAHWVDLFAADAPALDPPPCETCGTGKVRDAEMSYFLLCPVCTPGSLRPADSEVSQ